MEEIPRSESPDAFDGKENTSRAGDDSSNVIGVEGVTETTAVECDTVPANPDPDVQPAAIANEHEVEKPPQANLDCEVLPLVDSVAVAVTSCNEPPTALPALPAKGGSRPPSKQSGRAATPQHSSPSRATSATSSSAQVKDKELQSRNEIVSLEEGEFSRLVAIGVTEESDIHNRLRDALAKQSRAAADEHTRNQKWKHARLRLADEETTARECIALVAKKSFTDIRVLEERSRLQFGVPRTSSRQRGDIRPFSVTDLIHRQLHQQNAPPPEVAHPEDPAIENPPLMSGQQQGRTLSEGSFVHRIHELRRLEINKKKLRGTCSDDASPTDRLVDASEQSRIMNTKSNITLSPIRRLKAKPETQGVAVAQLHKVGVTKKSILLERAAALYQQGLSRTEKKSPSRPHEERLASIPANSFPLPSTSEAAGIIQRVGRGYLLRMMASGASGGPNTIPEEHHSSNTTIRCGDTIQTTMRSSADSSGLHYTSRRIATRLLQEVSEVNSNSIDEMLRAIEQDMKERAQLREMHSGERMLRSSPQRTTASVATPQDRAAKYGKQKPTAAELIQRRLRQGDQAMKKRILQLDKLTRESQREQDIRMKKFELQALEQQTERQHQLKKMRDELVLEREAERERLQSLSVEIRKREEAIRRSFDIRKVELHVELRMRYKQESRVEALRNTLAEMPWATHFSATVPSLNLTRAIKDAHFAAEGLSGGIASELGGSSLQDP